MSDPDTINEDDFLETLDGQDLDKPIPEVYVENSNALRVIIGINKRLNHMALRHYRLMEHHEM